MAERYPTEVRRSPRSILADVPVIRRACTAQNCAPNDDGGRGEGRPIGTSVRW